MFHAARQSLEKLLAGHGDFPPPVAPADVDARATLRARLHAWQAQERARYARFFLHERPLLVARRERELFALLERQGLAHRLAPGIYLPCVRLFPLYGRLLATDLASRTGPDQVFPLMVEQVYLVRNMDVRPDDDVLELCLGSGVNALFAADVARAVTGVDINPRALAFARFNAALNPAAVPLGMHVGSLFEPLAPEHRFDTILVNPPFELVPREETYFLHSDGGEDGLDLVRPILLDAPRFLAPAGRFQVITWSPGTALAPRLLDLLRTAFPLHRITMHVLDVQPLDAHLETFHASPHFAPWRARLVAQGLTRVWFVYVHVAPAATPGVEILEPATEIEACDAVAAAWLP